MTDKPDSTSKSSTEIKGPPGDWPGQPTNQPPQQSGVDPEAAKAAGVLDTSMDEPQPFITSDARTAVGEVELIGGHLHEDPNGGIQRMHIVTMNEMTGDDEDILMNKKIDVVRRFNLILSNCMERIGDGEGHYITDKRKFPSIVDNLCNADKQILLIFLRMISVPEQEKFTFSSNCPNCRAEFKKTADLSKLRRKPMKDPMQRMYEITLPSGDVARCIVLNGPRERIAEQASGKGESLATASLLARVLEVNGVPATIGTLKGMKLRDRNALRSAFTEHEGQVEATDEAMCQSCGARFEVDIDIFQPSFFFPSETPRS